MRRFLVGLAIAGIAILSPLAAIADDDHIAQKIVAKLGVHQKAGELKGFDLDLRVHNGTVVLKGYVANSRQEELVLKTAQGVDGVAKVMNDLAVKGKSEGTDEPAKSEPAKTEPAAEATRSPLAELGGVANATFQRSADQAPTAKKAAKSVSRSDQDLLRRVANSLREQKQLGNLKDFNVNLSVSEGSVWLKGRVASQQQRDHVLDICRNLSGVVKVFNQLEVISQPQQVIKPVSMQRPQPVVAVPVPAQAVAQTAPRPLQPQAATAVRPQQPLAFARSMQPAAGQPMPTQNHHATFGANQQIRYDQPNVPAYAWPSYAAYPNYGAVTYPKSYSPSAWPYIGPFYPYPQVPLGWRSVTLEWDDGWWFLDFRARRHFRHR